MKEGRVGKKRSRIRSSKMISVDSNLNLFSLTAPKVQNSLMRPPIFVPVQTGTFPPPVISNAIFQNNQVGDLHIRQLQQSQFQGFWKPPQLHNTPNCYTVPLGLIPCQSNMYLPQNLQPQFHYPQVAMMNSVVVNRQQETYPSLKPFQQVLSCLLYTSPSPRDS
eukprot:TRINITY_DN24762_c0_g1_i1.p1 TRINITY_DN24762_c0_g1~~TRINITY_DN24762_c0_g1_i1.p1  ORF type:complete len:164 (+),score=3.30 TRINITY_DN24762_c0_g1_i1:206-697(+)